MPGQEKAVHEAGLSCTASYDRPETVNAADVNHTLPQCRPPARRAADRVLAVDPRPRGRTATAAPAGHRLVPYSPLGYGFATRLNATMDIAAFTRQHAHRNGLAIAPLKGG
jgi:hypothetical protein